jgi:putative acetyltransferase
MDAPVIRRARLDDAEGLCALHKASIRGLCAGAHSPQQIEAWLATRVADDFRHAMTVGGETILVAVRGARLAGFASTRAAELLGLYVDPDLGRGAGRVLLQAAEEHVRHRGVTALSLQATMNAAAFYERHGYSRDRDDAVMRGGHALPVIEMHKDLGRP